MKNIKSILVVLAMLVTVPAMADTVRSTDLKASNGTSITIGWAVHDDYNPNTGIGTVTALNIGVTVYTDGGSQAVLINNCRNVNGSHYQNTYTCNLTQATGGSGSSVCTFGSVVVNISTESAGATTSCSQQISIVMNDNSWLTDPVNGSHNFNFSLQ